MQTAVRQSLGDLAQDRDRGPQRLALLPGELLQTHGEPLVAALSVGVEQLGALGGQPDDAGPPVGRARGPLHQATAFQVVDQPRHRRGTDLLVRRQLTDLQLALAQQHTHRRQLAGRQLLGVGAGLPQVPGQPEHRGAQLTGQLQDRLVRGHESTILLSNAKYNFRAADVHPPVSASWRTGPGVRDGGATSRSTESTHSAAASWRSSSARIRPTATWIVGSVSARRTRCRSHERGGSQRDLTPTPDQAIRAPISAFSSLLPTCTRGTPCANASVTPV